jgi:hypothetical protein
MIDLKPTHADIVVYNRRARQLRPIQPDKGKLGGSCNVRSCQVPGAYWFNRSTQQHYCEVCAGEINRWSMYDDQIILCHPVS